MCIINNNNNNKTSPCRTWGINPTALSKDIFRLRRKLNFNGKVIVIALMRHISLFPYCRVRLNEFKILCSCVTKYTGRDTFAERSQNCAKKSNFAMEHSISFVSRQRFRRSIKRTECKCRKKIGTILRRSAKVFSFVYILLIFENVDNCG